MQTIPTPIEKDTVKRVNFFKFAFDWWNWYNCINM